MIRFAAFISAIMLVLVAAGCGLGPGWKSVQSFRGDAPPSPGGDPIWRWSSPFHIDGGRLRIVGKLSSKNPNDLGLSLALRRRSADGKWVDVSDQPAPHDNAMPSGGTVKVDWSTPKFLTSGDYRLGIMDGDMAGGGEKFDLDVYAHK
jgi:hypothetical protein